jgi:putative addiction module component (TIGR02574 family)
MGKTVAEKLTDVVDAVRDLPTDTQEALVRELEDRVADLTKGHLSEGQRSEIKRRLAGPREHVPDETVRAILRRYNPDL